MWTATSEKLSDANGLRFSVALNSRPATVADVIDGWRHDAEFRTFFNSLLVDVPFVAFRWENVPLPARLFRHPLNLRY